MSVVLSVIIVVLAMLILGLMQLTPGVFSIFCHAMLGKYSNKKADGLMLSFILGAEFFVAAIWLLIYLIFYAFYVGEILWWVLSGIMVALGLMFLLFYFRKSKGTELFIPKKWSENLVLLAEKTKCRKDAFWLGFFTAVPELIFTLPIFVISALVIQDSLMLPRAGLVIVLVLVTIIPLFAIYAMFRSDNNLADVTRLRVHFKPLIRLLMPILYWAIAILSINMGIHA